LEATQQMRHAAIFLHCGRLLFRHVADDRHMPLLIVEGFDCRDYRQDENGQGQEGHEYPSDDGNQAEDDVSHDRSQSQEKSLEGVKANKAVPIERLNEKKNYRWYEQISQ
jgi:hypothetical protein